MSVPYDYEALWTKAKLFINHALDADEFREFDERAMWASLALEILAKAALAKVSPLLIAVPNEEGTNLLIASGLMAGDARFRSIPAKTLYARCARAFKPFSFREAEAITKSRNEYLHGSTANFVGMPADAWWPKYWAQASVLVNALDMSIEEFVGQDRAKQVEVHLAQNQKNVEERLQMLVERARQRLKLYESGGLPARVAAEWAKNPILSIGLAYSTDFECPACSELGTLEGDNVADAEPHYEQISEDDYDAWMDLTVDADYFSCENCRLVLDSYELLMEAGLPAYFEAEGDMAEFAEPEYGND